MTDKTAPEERSRDASREPLNDMEDGSVPASLPTADPAETLSRLLNGYQATQALHVAARLGIVDVLQDGPKTAQVLADRVGAHEPSLRRFLGFLTTLGLLTHDSEGHFAATPVGALLRADHPESERPWALLLGAPPIWQPWGELYEAVVSGRPAFERVYGERFFTYLGHNPEQAALFNAAMSSDSANVADILDAYDFSGSHTIVDVGGGRGALLRGILERAPQAKGILFDLPAVLAEAEAGLEAREVVLTGKCERVGGDMFQSVPAGAMSTCSSASSMIGVMRRPSRSCAIVARR